MDSTATRSTRQPRIVITLADITRAADPVLADDKNELYIAAIRRAGGDPLPLNEHSTQAQRRQAFAAMEGLLLSGGADIDPSRYGQPMNGARDIQPERDELEIEALAAANARRLPVLGICRGLQALNAFSGGTLLQHVEGHETPDPMLTGLARHDLEIRPGTRLAGILVGRVVEDPATSGTADPATRTADPATRGTADPATRTADLATKGAAVPAGGATKVSAGRDAAAPDVVARLVVNSYHHQGITQEGLAPGFVSSGTAVHPGGILVEALETTDPERFLIGVQCHPERLTSTPQAFVRLFRAFVQAAAHD